MTRFPVRFRRCGVLAVAAYSVFLNIHAHAVTTSWNTNSGGSFTFAANWNNGVPDSDDTAVFNRGAGVVYNVTFPGGNYPINDLRVRTNEVTFSDDGSPSSLAVIGPGVSIFVGQDAGDVAILNTSLSSLSGLGASIGRNAGANGTLNVSAGAFIMSSGLDVGDAGTGTLNVTAGGSVSNTIGLIGHHAGSTGAATVAGAGSTWVNSAHMYVGHDGTGTLTIQAGGSVSDTFAYIGGFAGSNGTATVTGTGSTWTNSNQLGIGIGATGTMRVEAGGSVSNTFGDLGYDPGSTGTAIVNGAGSTWINSLDLDIGQSGTGTLTIEAGGTVSSSNFSTIGYDSASNGTVTVTGAGSNWTNSGSFGIGIGVFGTGMLAIEAGGSVSTTAGVIGDISGSNGSATVTGIGSTWTNSGFLFVGDAGAGMLTIEAGGRVSNTSSRLGNFFGSTGTATVTGAGATWTNNNTLYVGYGGSGTLTIEDGGSVSNSDGFVGFQSGSNGMVTVTGAGSTWTNSGELNVGYSGTGTRTLKIEAGGSVSNTNGIVGSVFGSNGEGTVTVTGAGSTWNSSGSVYIGGSAFSAGGVGTLSVETGATVNIGDDLKLWGDGTVNLSGGQINLVNGENLIFSGGAFNFDYGTLNFTTSQTIQAGGKIEQALGGERRVRVSQHLGVEGVATLNAPFHIDGGGLEVDSLVVNSQLLFTAGLLEVRGGSITGLTSLVVPASGEFRTSGVHLFRVTGLAGSSITATGALTLGNASAMNGFGTQGAVQVGANTLTLLDANDVVFDSLALATLGSGASPGTLSAANGLTLDFGGNVTGFGTVSTPNNAVKPLINNGHITGNSPAQRITLPGYVKGVGTFDNVTFTGTYSPGFSPAITMVGNIIFSPGSTLIMEIGGLSPGSEHDQIISSGQLVFDGTMQVALINGFSPTLGQEFNLFDWVNASGSFDAINLPTLGASFAWDTSQLYIDGTLSIASAGLDGDFNYDGAVNAADYVAWRKGVGVASTTANYNLWRTNFGRTSGGGSSPPVPEPGTMFLATMPAYTCLILRRRGSHACRA